MCTVRILSHSWATPYAYFSAERIRDGGGPQDRRVYPMDGAHRSVRLQQGRALLQHHGPHRGHHEVFPPFPWRTSSCVPSSTFVGNRWSIVCIMIPTADTTRYFPLSPAESSCVPSSTFVGNRWSIVCIMIPTADTSRYVSPCRENNYVPPSSSVRRQHLERSLREGVLRASYRS